MNKIYGITALLVGLSAVPAAATEWVSCTTPGGEASFDYLVGTLDVLGDHGLNVTTSANRSGPLMSPMGRETPSRSGRPRDR